MRKAKDNTVTDAVIYQELTGNNGHQALADNGGLLTAALEAAGYTLVDALDLQGKQVTQAALAAALESADGGHADHMYLVWAGDRHYLMTRGVVDGDWTRKRVRQVTRIEGRVEITPPAVVPGHPPTADKRKKKYDRTSPRGACAMVWDLAEKLPGASRKEIIAAAVEQGIHPTTASVQYYKWQKAGQ